MSRGGDDRNITHIHTHTYIHIHTLYQRQHIGAVTLSPISCLILAHDCSSLPLIIIPSLLHVTVPVYIYIWYIFSQPHSFTVYENLFISINIEHPTRGKVFSGGERVTLNCTGELSFPSRPYRLILPSGNSRGFPPPSTHRRTKLPL